MVNSKTLSKSSSKFDVELISDFIDGILDSESKQRIQEAIAQDEYLADLVEGVKQLKSEGNLNTMQLVTKLTMASSSCFQKHFGSPGKTARYSTEYQTGLKAADQIDPNTPNGLPPYESNPQNNSSHDNPESLKPNKRKPE